MPRKINGTCETIQCVHPILNEWMIAWDIVEGKSAICEFFDHKPTIDEIKQVILNWYNEQTDEKILSGFVWNDMPVWLSMESQFNYKAAYDIAVQSNGTILPTFKFGTTENPVYHKFESLEDLQDFYFKALTYVQNTIAEGWQIKDSINWDNYIV